jgi:DNA-binding transcriptional LysR family regulator
MDSEALKTFLTIHQANGFSSAAERLHRSQPAISRRIAQLEDEIGAPLFERAASGVVLSQVGRVLLPHAQRVLAALRDASDAIGAVKTNAGPVSVACVGTLASTNLTVVLKRFAAQCPSAALSLRTATSSEVSELVRAGEVSIGLRYFDDPSADLVCEVLAEERLVVVCAREHRFADKGVRTLRQLRHEHWLSFPDRYEQREASTANIFAQLLTHGIAEIDWTPVDSLTAQKRLIEAGFGVALLPESSIDEERRRKTLSTIAVADLDAANPIAAIVRKDGYLSPASRKLLALLRAEFSVR